MITKYTPPCCRAGYVCDAKQNRRSKYSRRSNRVAILDSVHTLRCTQYYLHRRWGLCKWWRSSVCLSMNGHDYTKSSQAIFLKPRRIINYCFGKSCLNLGVDPTQSGRMAAIFWFLLQCMNGNCKNHMMWASYNKIFSLSFPRWCHDIAYRPYIRLGGGMRFSDCV